MFLRQFSITNYKNYERQKLSFQRKINCFVGANGMGKTNLLDALYYLCITKSYTSSNDKQVIRHGADFLRLEAEVELHDEAITLTGVTGHEVKKTFQWDEVKYDRLSEHVGRMPVIIITPDDNTLINGGSEERRRFLDSLMAQMDRAYLEHLQLYNRALQQRNALLKQFAETGRWDNNLLEGYDRQLTEHGDAVHAARQAIVEQMQAPVQRYYKAISGDHEQVALGYHSPVNEKAMGSLLNDNRQLDRLSKRTTEGIHRDDLDFSMDGHPVKQFGSQGQQKSFLLALKLTQYELLQQQKGFAPFLLLDDVFDKLDADRCSNLLRFIADEQFGQIFITDTHRERIESIFADEMDKVEVFAVVEGKVLS